MNKLYISYILCKYNAVLILCKFCKYLKINMAYPLNIVQQWVFSSLKLKKIVNTKLFTTVILIQFSDLLILIITNKINWPVSGSVN